MTIIEYLAIGATIAAVWVVWSAPRKALPESPIVVNKRGVIWTGDTVTTHITMKDIEP